jgi:BMFP domain-containing protein YqiC
MALKPPPLGDVLQQINSLVTDQGLRGEADKTLKALLQSALARLDVVSRDEFDAQAAVLKKTRARVTALEAELEAVSNELAALEGKPQ